jgi:hypothetical protein
MTKFPEKRKRTAPAQSQKLPAFPAPFNKEMYPATKNLRRRAEIQDNHPAPSASVKLFFGSFFSREKGTNYPPR